MCTQCITCTLIERLMRSNIFVICMQTLTLTQSQGQRKGKCKGYATCIMFMYMCAQGPQYDGCCGVVKRPI